MGMHEISWFWNGNAWQWICLINKLAWTGDNTDTIQKRVKLTVLPLELAASQSCLWGKKIEPNYACFGSRNSCQGLFSFITLVRVNNQFKSLCTYTLHRAITRSSISYMTLKVFKKFLESWSSSPNKNYF